VGSVGGVDVSAETVRKARSPGEVFIKPAMAKYFESLKALITPTEEELALGETNI